MATVTREPIGPLHDKITVKLSKEDYLPAFEKGLKQYAKQANVPGFRKGAVPAGMMKKMHGQSLFQDEVVRTASRQLEDYLTTEKVQIFAQPLILPQEAPLRMDMNAPDDVSFAFEVGLKPEVDIPALNGSRHLTRYKISVTDAMVEDEISRITRRYGKPENPETITHGDNIIGATFMQTSATGDAESGAEKKEETLLVEKLPAKLREAVMGKKAGDTILVHPVSDFSAEELATFMQEVLKADVSAGEYTWEMAITKITLLIPRDLDIMLFAEVFPNESFMDEAIFRNKIKEELQREYDKAAMARLNDEIYETLVHDTPISLPAPFLKRWMSEGGEKPKSPQQVEKEYPGFDHQLRWTLISDKIIGEAGINVTKEDIIADMRGKVLAYFGLQDADEAPWMDSYMQKMEKEEKTMNETYRQILFQRLFDYLQTKFVIDEKEISEQEFFKLPSPHDAHHHAH